MQLSSHDEKVTDGLFDKKSGNYLERIVFNYRQVFLLICLLLSIFLGVKAFGIGVNAGFDKMIPANHHYIKNYFENRDKLGALGNTLRIVIENPNGSIYDNDFLEITKNINDKVFLMPGVDRAFMKSIWMPSVRWTEVTEEGFRGGPVISENYDGSPEALKALRTSILRAGISGSLVSKDETSIMLVIPLLEKNAETGEPLDYKELSKTIEDNIRQPYESAEASVNIYVVGFAKLVGDLIEGLEVIFYYFLIALLISAVIILLYTKCWRSTFVVVFCSCIAVVWQLGIVKLLGFDLDPYSILVPFLVFAIGVSHGAQKMNGIMQDIGRGIDKYIAARYTFRRLFLAGLTAILADVVGFAVLAIFDIPVIQELAIVASVGVAVLVVTNLLLLPVLLSYVGVSHKAATNSLKKNGDTNTHSPMAQFFAKFTELKTAKITVMGAGILSIFGFWIALDLKIGDLDPGAPELRPESRYNQDVNFINKNYALSTDEFITVVKTPVDGCADYEAVKITERLSWVLRNVEGVQHTTSIADNVARSLSGYAEGNPKWLSVPNNVGFIGTAVERTLNDNPDVVDKACSIIPVVAYLKDHKAETLERVVYAVEEFAKKNNSENVDIQLAAGSAGIEAVTNMVVKDANRTMLFYVYAAVTLLCLITFKNWRAAIVAVVPLVITSILCEALMVMLGIGVKVSTLPVVALGVGIGVDYALYLLSVQLAYQRSGMSLTDAYKAATDFTGKVIALIGVTLAAGVVTWIWSPIKFQADMGILLAFMFLWNMIGALVLIPALSRLILYKKEHY